MTGAGSLSPSPQPVTKTPAELSLIGGPAHSIAAVISAAPLGQARERFEHRPDPIRLRIAAPKFAQEQNFHRLRDASRFQIGGSIDEGPFRKAISGIFATWALFVRAPRSDLLSEVPLSHSRSVRMLALLMALQRRLRTPPLFMVCSGERQEVGDRVCCYNSPDGSW